MKLAYPVKIRPNDGIVSDAVLLSFPDLSGTEYFSRSLTIAFSSASSDLDNALANLIDNNADIPEPSDPAGRPTVSPSITIAAKALLYIEMRRQGIWNAELARRMGRAPQEITTLLDPASNTKIGTIEEALKAIGNRLVVSVE